MSYTRRIAHNTIIQIIGKAISTAIGVFVIALLTRYLGRAGFGQYYTILAFLQIFGVIVDMGLYIILIKKMSEPGTDRDVLASNIFTLRFISAFVLLGLAPLAVLFFPYPAIVKTGVLIATLSYFAITLNQTLTGVFQVHLQMYKTATAEVVGRIVLLLGTIYVIRQDAGLLWVMVVVVLGSLLNFFITFAYAKKLVRIRPRFDLHLWKDILRESWPIALSIIFNLVYFKADTIILSLYKGADEVGIYGASYRVLEVLITFPAMFAGLVTPLLASSWAAQDRERFKRVLRKGFDFMAMIAIPLVVGTIFLATPVMNLVAPSFTNADKVLRILIVATATIFIGNLFGNTVVALNKQKTMMWLYIVVAVVSLVGYLVLIPRFSYFGAAAMTVASELMVTIAALVIVGVTSRIWPSFVLFGKSLIAAGVMAIALSFLQSWNLFLLIVIALVVYSVMLFLLRAISKETIYEILRLRGGDNQATPV